MKAARVETLVWVLIYGGLLSLSLGFFAAPRAETLGYGLMLAGGVAAVVGVVLIFLRARMKPEDPQ